MNRIAALSAVFGLFMVGVLVGVIGTHLWQGHAPWRPGIFHPEGPLSHEGPFVEHLARRLGLTEEQQDEIGAILAESRIEADELRRQVLPEVRAHMEQTHERLMAVLTPEQREEFETLASRHRGRMERFLLGHGHGPPPWRGNGPRREGRRPQPPPPGE
jgi:Spy/CpxP family protein refolding chaperone